MVFTMLATLLTLAITVTPEAYCTGNCNADWTPTFNAMFEACSPQPMSTDTIYKKAQGCKVELQCRIYDFKLPLTMDRPHLIEGCGSRGNWGNTILRFAGDGVQMPGASARVTLRDLHIMGKYRGTGVFARATISLEDVKVSHFKYGIHIRASYNRDRGNANVWYVQNTVVQNMLGWGMYVEGADANAGTAIALNISNTCEKVPQGEQCWALRDRSFLGNTYIGPHTAYTFNPKNRKEEHVQYWIENINGPSVLINPYQETATPGSHLTGSSVAVGGRLQNPSGDPTFTILGRNGKGLRTYSTNTPNGTVRLGDGAAAWRLTDEGVDLRYMMDLKTLVFGWRPNGAGIGAMAVTNHGSKDAHGNPLKVAAEWFGRNGGVTYTGQPNAMIARITGAGDPNKSMPHCGQHPAGSIYTNARPETPNNRWVCVCEIPQTPTWPGKCLKGEKIWRQ